MTRPETIMSYDSLPKGSVVLRLEFSIADAVYQRGLLAVLAAAITAWWHRPKVPADLTDRLRADIGLLPNVTPAHWLDITANRTTPPPLRRPGM